MTATRLIVRRTEIKESVFIPYHHPLPLCMQQQQQQPQPPPVPKGDPVTPLLVDWLIHSFAGTLSAEQIVDINEKLIERYHFGLQKYGQPLMTKDGRDEVVDAREEALDMLQYVYKAKLNGRYEEARKELVPYVVILAKLLEIRVDDDKP
jgi:hypothetical protein